MDDLLEARRKSHEFRKSTMHDVVINNNGTMVGEALDETNTQLDIDAVLAKRPGIRTSPIEALSNITMEDVTDVAKAGGRAVLGGVQDAVTGVVGLASDIGSYLDENVGSLGYVRMGPNGFEYMRELPPGEDVMRLDDAFEAGLKNLGIDVPQGDSSAEAIARGLIQFGAGMAAAPVRGASYLSMMARGGFADALFDPEAGNLSTLLREYGLDNAVLEYLDSKVDEDADAAARLEARFKQSLEGAGLGIPIDMVVTGFRLAKSNDGLRETIRNKLTTVKDRLTQPGDMPTTSAFGAGAIDEAKPSAAELRRQANIQRFGYDPNEAPVDTSYRMEHQPRGPEGGEGIRLDDLTKNISGEQAGYPDDFYTPRGADIYARGPSFPDDEYGMANQESYKIITSVRNNPDAEVTIYRAVPNEDAVTTINPGDFVTLSRKYAELHSASGYGRSGDEPGKIIEQKVKVRDIYWDGNDVNEFGYFPESSTAPQSLPDMIEKKYPNVTLDISGNPEKGYELSRISIPKGERGEGIGTQVMQDMIAMADEQGARISLTPDISFGGTSVARLKKFYKRFGFVENKGKNKDFSIRNTMYRNPQSTGGAD